MLATAAALAFGHVLADFVLQSDAMVRDKHRPLVLLGHVAIVAAVSWLALGLPLAPWPVALVAASHLVIDALKVEFGGPGFRPFILDQAAHLAAILVVAGLYPATFAAGLWADPRLPHAEAVPATMLLAAGLVATVWAGGHAVGTLMQGIALPADPESNPSLPQGGRLIGQLERLMIYILVLSGEIVGIGLLIAAKSILRFGEIQSSESRLIAEYVIIGTLASFAWALGISIAVVRMLPLLG